MPQSYCFSARYKGRDRTNSSSKNNTIFDCSHITKIMDQISHVSHAILLASSRVCIENLCFTACGPVSANHLGRPKLSDSRTFVIYCPKHEIKSKIHISIINLKFSHINSQDGKLPRSL